MSEQDIREAVNELWGLPKGSRYYPVPLPVSLTRENLARVMRGRYLCSAKTDGVRAVLVLSNDRRDTCFAGLITRKGDLVLSFQAAAKGSRLFDGTLLDGEWIESRRTFVAFDCLALRGYDWKRREFREFPSLIAND